MKTKEELNALKEEVEALNKKLAELTEEEFTQVSGGIELPGIRNADQLHESKFPYIKPSIIIP